MAPWRFPRPRNRWLWVAAAVVAVLGVLAALVPFGVIWPNRVFAARYEVRGVDVSHYQGEIDWEELAAQDIDFAWIKATEGSSHVDPQFSENWAGATSSDLLVGAYHFMSFESPGADQAAHLASQVPATSGTLVPMIDLELYGRFGDHPPEAGQVRVILDDLMAGITEHYGTAPVVYVTGETYELYLADEYPELEVWIRSVALPPSLPDGRDWTLWQYSHRDRLDGYDGDERYIDMNVFAGNREEFEALTLR